MRLGRIKPLSALILFLFGAAAAGCRKHSPSLLSTLGKEAVLQSFEDLSLKDQVEVVPELRRILDANLLAPGEEVLAAFKDLLEHPEVRVNRILNRAKFEGFTLGRGGGAYFSFTTLAKDYDREPDLELQNWRFSSGFGGGNRGLVSRLAADNIATITLDDVPGNLKGEDPASLDREPHTGAEVQPGDVCAVRSVRWDESDLLVAVQVLERDDYGLTFAWRVLKKYPCPRR